MYQLVYQKITIPNPLACHSFLHRINISGAKIRPVLKTIHDTYFMNYMQPGYTYKAVGQGSE